MSEFEASSPSRDVTQRKVCSEAPYHRSAKVFHGIRTKSTAIPRSADAGFRKSAVARMEERCKREKRREMALRLGGAEAKSFCFPRLARLK